VGEKNPVQRISFDDNNKEVVVPAHQPKVTVGTYWQYFRAGGITSFTLFVFSCFTAEILFFGSDYWLNMWTIAEMARRARSKETNEALNLNNSTNIRNNSMPCEGLSTELDNDWVLDTTMGIYVYSILVGGVFVFGYLRASQFYMICSRSSEELHDKMLRAVLRAPVQFFEQNTVGKLISSVSYDIFC